MSNLRTPIWAILVLVGGDLSSLSGFVASAEMRKPNLLIVMTDDQGLGDFSFTGNPGTEDAAPR